MSYNANFFPASVPADGLWDLILVDGDLPTIKGAKTLLATESDKFFDLPQVTYKKISAYRLIPRTTDACISIDGERVPYEPFQVEVHKGLGRVISQNGKFEAKGPRGWRDVKIANTETTAVSETAANENANSDQGTNRETGTSGATQLDEPEESSSGDTTAKNQAEVAQSVPKDAEFNESVPKAKHEVSAAA